MKSENELDRMASTISKAFDIEGFNYADVFVILEMLRHNAYHQLDKAVDKQKEGHKVKIE